MRSTMLRTSWLVLGCLVATAGCRSTMLVALPSNDAEWLSDFAAKATEPEHEVSIEAHLHAWQGEPRDLEGRATPVLVRIENHGSTPVQIVKASFELMSGTSSFRTLAPERIVDRPAPLAAEELRDAVLGPGESRSGFLYFPRMTGYRGFVHLRAALLDTSRALLGSIDIPFGSGHVERCSLAYVDEREPRAPTNMLFHTCLPPY